MIEYVIVVSLLYVEGTYGGLLKGHVSMKICFNHILKKNSDVKIRINVCFRPSKIMPHIILIFKFINILS